MQNQAPTKNLVLVTPSEKTSDTDERCVCPYNGQQDNVCRICHND